MEIFNKYLAINITRKRLQAQDHLQRHLHLTDPISQTNSNYTSKQLWTISYISMLMEPRILRISTHHPKCNKTYSPIRLASKPIKQLPKTRKAKFRYSTRTRHRSRRRAASFQALLSLEPGTKDLAESLYRIRTDLSNTCRRLRIMPELPRRMDSKAAIHTWTPMPLTAPTSKQI